MTTAKTPEGRRVEVVATGHMITLRYCGVQLYYGDNLETGLASADKYINKYGLEVTTSR